MKEKSLGLVVGIFLVLSLFSVSSLAVKHVPKRIVKAKQQMNLFSKLKMFLEKGIRPLTIVGNCLCSKYPDDSGTCYATDVYCHIKCPSSARCGCAIDVFDENYNFKYEVEVKPGRKEPIRDGNKYEVYECSQPTCDCTRYKSQGCGRDGCASNEMYKTRDCDPEGCADEQTCVYRDKCVTTTTTTTTTTITTTTIPPKPGLAVKFLKTILSAFR